MNKFIFVVCGQLGCGCHVQTSLNGGSTRLETPRTAQVFVRVLGERVIHWKCGRAMGVVSDFNLLG